MLPLIGRVHDVHDDDMVPVEHVSRGDQVDTVVHVISDVPQLGLLIRQQGAESGPGSDSGDTWSLITLVTLSSRLFCLMIISEVLDLCSTISRGFGGLNVLFLGFFSSPIIELDMALSH